MEFELGIVCGRCEAYAALGTASCASCGNALALEAQTPAPAPVSKQGPPTTKNPEPAAPSSRLPESAVPRTVGVIPRDEPAPVSARSGSGGRRFDPRAEEDDGSSTPRPPPSGGGPAASRSKGKSIEELMDQAKNFVCRSCSTPVPMGHKFCGRCGAAVPPEILHARTQFFGQLQELGKAKLILIRGEGGEGLSYQLNAEHHVVGRTGEIPFSDDPFVSNKHADFFYKSAKLFVKDLGSVNGVYLRVRGSVEIQPGDYFSAGEQIFRFDLAPNAMDEPGEDGTFFYSSPKHKTPFRITQILQGGPHGMTVCARGTSLQIGREGNDLNFPSDLYMSAAHCKLEDVAGKMMLTDLTSRNGTYVRLRDERELAHGDYLFIGRKLLRVEITAA